MSSLGRMLAILDLFTEERPTWTPEQIAEELEYTQPTVYRYLQQLMKAGLIRRGPGGGILLGGRIIEFDYQMRLADPVLTAAQKIMRELAQQTGCDVMLAGIVGDRFITIHHEPGNEGFVPSYGRGRRLPYFRSSLSKALLAAMPRSLLRRLYERNAGEVARAGFGASWDEFLAKVKAIRREGRSVSMGELDSGLVGVSVPMTDLKQETPVSLGLAMSETRFFTADVERLTSILKTRAGEILSSMSSAGESLAAGPGLRISNGGGGTQPTARRKADRRHQI
jgi:DNA-binding IclR family transcriptional regulator